MVKRKVGILKHGYNNSAVASQGRPCCVKCLAATNKQRFLRECKNFV